jgi:hypothetical protein
VVRRKIKSWQILVTGIFKSTISQTTGLVWLRAKIGWQTWQEFFKSWILKLCMSGVWVKHDEHQSGHPQVLGWDNDALFLHREKRNWLVWISWDVRSLHLGARVIQDYQNARPNVFSRKSSRTKAQEPD